MVTKVMPVLLTAVNTQVLLQVVLVFKSLGTLCTHELPIPPCCCRGLGHVALADRQTEGQTCE